ncbi:MAG: hypothetical protein ACXW2I_00040 [Burkholderiales bacterium]
MSTPIPASISREHRQLHDDLARATMEPGLLGVRARELADVLRPHFAKEEGWALPPLGLLAKLAWGGATQEMAAMLPVTRRLAAELPVMLLEHKQIVAAVAAFRSAAREVERADYLRLADALLMHAQQEEEVLYPAAVLVGAYLEVKLHAAEQPEPA